MRVEGQLLRAVAMHGPSRQWVIGTTRSSADRPSTCRSCSIRSLNRRRIPTRECHFVKQSIGARRKLRSNSQDFRRRNAFRVGALAATATYSQSVDTSVLKLPQDIEFKATPTGSTANRSFVRRSNKAFGTRLGQFATPTCGIELLLSPIKRII